MVCTVCGKETDERKPFCGYCGTAIHAEKTEAKSNENTAAANLQESTEAKSEKMPGENTETAAANLQENTEAKSEKMPGENTETAAANQQESIEASEIKTLESTENTRIMPKENTEETGVKPGERTETKTRKAETKPKKSKGKKRRGKHILLITILYLLIITAVFCYFYIDLHGWEAVPVINKLI